MPARERVDGINAAAELKARSELVAIAKNVEVFLRRPCYGGNGEIESIVKSIGDVKRASRSYKKWVGCS